MNYIFNLYYIVILIFMNNLCEFVNLYLFISKMLRNYKHCKPFATFCAVIIRLNLFPNT